MTNLNMDMMCISEIWGKKNEFTKFKLQQILELEGFELLVDIRPYSTGGGTAIAINKAKFKISRIHTPQVTGVKYTAAFVKSTQVSVICPKLLVLAFYSLPSSRIAVRKKLIENMHRTIVDAKADNSQLVIIVAGDRNGIPISDLLGISPRLVQLVDKPTRKNKILDVILTDSPGLFGKIDIFPPLTPDNPATHKPSDHSIPVTQPIYCSTERRSISILR